MNRTFLKLGLFFCLLTPSWGADLIKAGDQFSLGGNQEGANACYNAAVVADPGSSLELEFLLRRSRVGRKLGEEELAAALLHRARSLAVSRKEVGNTGWLLGLDAFFVGDYRTARDFFSQALLEHPDPPIEVLYYLGWSLYQTEQYRAARNVFLNLVDLNRGQFSPQELAFLLAMVDYRTGDYQTVLATLTDAPSYSKGSWYREYALHLAGYAAFRTDTLKEALRHFSHLEDTINRALFTARVQLEQAEFGKAAETYSTLELCEASYGEAVAYYLDGKSSLARKAARDCLDHEPEKELAAACYLLLGCIELDKGRSKSAVALLNQGAELDSPYLLPLIRTLARAYFAGRDFRNAYQTSQELLTRFPGCVGRDGYRLLSARSLFYLGRTEEAEEEVKDILASTEDPVITNQAHYLLGEAWARKGDYIRAAEEFAYVREGSLHPRAVLRQGEVYAAAGRHRLAIDAFGRALGLIPDPDHREEIILAIEESRLALGIYPDRITMLKKYIERYPHASHAPEIQLQVALEYLEHEDMLSCLHELNKLLARYGESGAAAEALGYKARCQRRLGRVDEAIAIYREIPKRFPSSQVASRSQVELAQLFLELGRESEALAVYRKLSSSAPTRSERASYLLDMAGVYESQSNHQTASDLVDAALEESQAASVVRRAYLLGAKVKLALGEVSSARNYASRYLRRFGETADYLLTLGEIEQASGRFSQGLSAYLRASQLFSSASSSRIRALLGAADCARLLGRNEEARQLLTQAAAEVSRDDQRIQITRRLQSLD